MAASEEQHGNETERSPKVTVLQDGCDIRPGDGNESDETENGGGNGNGLDPVNGAGDRRLWSVGGELA